jgi:uncharacterized membrane protein YgcG
VSVNTRKYCNSTAGRGFTIIQLSIVLTVVAIALLAYLNQGSGESQHRVFADNQVREAYIMQTISQFAVQYGYIPCPAHVSIAQGSPGYGVANCALATANTTATTLLAGMVPYLTLGLDPARYARDSWGDAYTYVMDKNFSTPLGFATATSAMVLNYPDGTQTNPAALVISHGASGMGAPLTDGTGNVTINPTVRDPASLNNAMCGGGWPTPQGPGGAMPVPAGVTCNGQFYVAAANAFNQQKSSGFDNVLAWRTAAQITNPAGGGGSGMAGSGGGGGSGGSGGGGGSGGSGGGGGSGGSGGSCLGLNSTCIHVLIPCCSPFTCIASTCQ